MEKLSGEYFKTLPELDSAASGFPVGRTRSPPAGPLLPKI